MLWATIACALVGFVLGAQYRLICLAVASALVTVGWPFLASEPTLLTGGLTILGLLFILQASFLAGAMVVAPFRTPRPVRRLSSLVENPPPCCRDDERNDGHPGLLR